MKSSSALHTMAVRFAPIHADKTSTLRIGDRAPDANLTTTDGIDQTLFDVFRGPHFTAVAYRSVASHDLDRLTWSPLGVKLRRVSVDAAHIQATQLAR